MQEYHAPKVKLLHLHTSYLFSTSEQGIRAHNREAADEECYSQGYTSGFWNSYEEQD